MFSKLLQYVGIVLIFAAALLIFQRYNPYRLSFANYENTVLKSEAQSQMPVRITIPAIGIDLPVIPAKIQNNVWQTTPAGVSYLTSSPIPGDLGNSILYGHNWTNLLGSLPRTKVGDSITVYFVNGKSKSFIVVGTAAVSPSQYSVLYSTGDEKLTIYTCSGFFDSKRFVVTAVPTKTAYSSFQGNASTL